MGRVGTALADTERDIKKAAAGVGERKAGLEADLDRQSRQFSADSGQKWQDSLTAFSDLNEVLRRMIVTFDGIISQIQAGAADRGAQISAKQSEIRRAISKEMSTASMSATEGMMSMTSALGSAQSAMEQRRATTEQQLKGMLGNVYQEQGATGLKLAKVMGGLMNQVETGQATMGGKLKVAFAQQSEASRAAALTVEEALTAAAGALGEGAAADKLQTEAMKAELMRKIQSGDKDLLAKLQQFQALAGGDTETALAMLAANEKAAKKKLGKSAAESDLLLRAVQSVKAEAGGINDKLFRTDQELANGLSNLALSLGQSEEEAKASLQAYLSTGEADTKKAMQRQQDEASAQFSQVSRQAELGAQQFEAGSLRLESDIATTLADAGARSKQLAGKVSEMDVQVQKLIRGEEADIGKMKEEFINKMAASQAKDDAEAERLKARMKSRDKDIEKMLK